MKYILYLSTACEVFYVEDMEKMLIKFRENNKKIGITGILLYSGRTFLQFLEGPQQSLDDMMAKINIDKRHYNIIKLTSGNSKTRLFPDWNMGFKVATDDEIKTLEGFIDPGKSGFQDTLDNNKRHPAISILKNFVKDNRMSV